MKPLRIVLAALVALAVLVAGSAPAAASPGITERVSVDSAGNESNSSSMQPAISADGRYVAFQSNATNLVAGDTCCSDIFVHDRQTETTQRVSVDSDGNEANAQSYYPAISGDGRHVAFLSWATNLVADDTNGEPEIFVHDRQTGATSRASVSSAGDEANGPSSDGAPAVSGDGRYVAFHSGATNLVPADTNGERDIFLHDRDTDEDGVFDEPGAIATVRVNVDSAGNEANEYSVFPAISADGRYVAFWSRATNLVPDDTNSKGDIFVHDRQTGATERVNVDSAGNEANDNGYVPPAISADGRYVAFPSWATNLVAGDTNSESDIFVHDRQTGITERVSVDSGGSEADDWSCGPAISASGRHVAFWSGATNLVADDTNGKMDVFLHDRQTGTTERVSVDSDGNEGSGESYDECGIYIVMSGQPSVSGDGRYVTFWSSATNLVPDDTSADWDVFVHDREVESVTMEAGADETVTTDINGDGASSWDPSETYLTTPNAGTVSIEETSVTAPPPAGFQFLAQQVSITAPPATTDAPLVIVFRIDTSQVPAGEDENTIQMFKDGVEVPACAGSPGTASPDPCVSNRILLPDGDVEITVLTSTASAWNFGAAAAPPVGGIAQLPDAADSSGRNYIPVAALTAVAAAALVALTAAAWYARRRWLG